MPSMEDSGSGIVSKEHAAQVMAIIFGAFYLAQIAATFFESFLGLFCEPTTELMWIIAIVFFLSITVMYLIYVIVTNKKQSLSE